VGDCETPDKSNSLPPVLVILLPARRWTVPPLLLVESPASMFTSPALEPLPVYKCSPPVELELLEPLPISRTPEVDVPLPSPVLRLSDPLDLDLEMPVTIDMDPPCRAEEVAFPPVIVIFPPPPVVDPPELSRLSFPPERRILPPTES